MWKIFENMFFFFLQNRYEEFYKNEININNIGLINLHVHCRKNNKLHVCETFEKF
jgi:hypothetical protein